jgi:superfamily I DNA/RNA helicase
MTFVPSTAQQAFFDWVSKGTGNCILEAVAGSGKTTTIVEALDLMQGSVFLGAYNKKMADELKAKVAGIRGVKASTFHGAGYGALMRAYRDSNRLELDENKVVKIAQSIADDQRRDDLDEIVGTVAKVVSMAKNRGIGALSSITDFSAWAEMVDTYGLCDEMPEGMTIECIVKFAQICLKRSNESLDTIDFDDMVYLPLQRQLRLFQNDWVLVDEAQDTNPTRRALAKAMLRPNGRLVAVGDPHQAIFGFTGADNDALQQISEAFNCTHLPLTITYRCPKAIVTVAQEYVSHIEAGDTAPVGAVESLDFNEIVKQAKVGDAILCRYNKYLVNLCFKFIRAGIPAKIEGRAIGEGLAKLAGRWKVTNLNVLEERLAAYAEREVAKAMKAEKEDRADRITDQVETLYVLIERAREQEVFSVAGLKAMILEMFSDKVGGENIILCSVHKSKGLEWNKVFLLGRHELMPSPFARQAWQQEQEINLIYVAVTRAKQTLVDVFGVKEIKKEGEA